MKKKISLATIICVGLSALIAILALFGAIKLEGVTFDLLFTFLTLTVAGILTINSCDMLEKKNKLAIISLSLICLSTLLVILCFWTTLDDANTFMKSTLIISTLSICFNLITSNVLKLNKNYRVIQTSAYVCYSIVTLYLILLFLNVIKLENTHLKIFILFIILSLVGMAVLAVLSKRQITESITSKEYIKISKEEYKELLQAKHQLKTLLEKKE